MLISNTDDYINESDQKFNYMLHVVSSDGVTRVIENNIIILLTLECRPTTNFTE